MELEICERFPVVRSFLVWVHLSARTNSCSISKAQIWKIHTNYSLLFFFVIIHAQPEYTAPSPTFSCTPSPPVTTSGVKATHAILFPSTQIGKVSIHFLLWICTMAILPRCGTDALPGCGSDALPGCGMMPFQRVVPMLFPLLLFIISSLRSSHTQH